MSPGVKLTNSFIDMVCFSGTADPKVAPKVKPQMDYVAAVEKL
jgi:hypothetical protein